MFFLLIVPCVLLIRPDLAQFVGIARELGFHLLSRCLQARPLFRLASECAMA